MSDEIRPSAIAGSWYPKDADQLKATIQHYLDEAQITPLNRPVRGLISPHAGYLYSGPVAAYGYKQLMGSQFDLVVLLSPMHHYPQGRYIVCDCKNYETPLGLVPVDWEIVRSIDRELELTYIASDDEHALEIQLPFLQVVLESFKILPIMVGHGQLHKCTDLVNALLPIFQKNRVLLVISTDLHHIPDYQTVIQRDEHLAHALEIFSLTEIYKILLQPECSVCGRVPLYAGLQLLDKLGARELTILDHRNSGDITGEKGRGQYTVGYLSAVVTE